jgi:ligand-binding sensor domain-containing protein
MPLLFLLIAAQSLWASPFRWTTYTSLSSVEDLLVADSVLWLGTSGGLANYDPSNNSFDSYNNTRGLAMNATAGLGRDAEGWIWIVAPDGQITRLNPENGSTRIVTDLANEIFDVSAIVRVGNEMFLGANNGLYRLAYFQVVDNYRVIERVRVLGSFPTSIAIQDLAIFQDHLYAATAAGLARAPLSTPQFSAPAAWENFTGANGLPANNVVDIVADPNQLVIAFQSGFADFDGVTFSSFHQTAETIRNLAVVGFDVYGTGASSVFKRVGDVFQSAIGNVPGIAALAEIEVDGASHLALGIADQAERPGGLRIWDGEILSPTLAPKGIGGNSVVGVEIDSQNRLWAATGGNRNGVSLLQDEEWSAYTRSDTLDGHFFQNPPNTMAADPFGGMWIGSDFTGVCWAQPDSLVFFNTVEAAGFDEAGARLSGFPGFPNNPIARVGKTSSGDILITNQSSLTNRPLAFVSRDWIAQGNHPTPWNYFLPETDAAADETKIGQALEDPISKRIWLGAQGDNTVRTYVLDMRSTPADIGDDVWASYDPRDIQDAATTCFEDINPLVTSFAVDAQNYLWVGTPNGAYYSQGGIPQNISSLRFICLYDLPVGHRVNDIHVDSHDNKWFATDEGVAVLDPTFTWIHVFQTSTSIDYSSDLASNSVMAITSNARTGEVWLATLDGLSRLTTPYVSRSAELETVRAYPNPFRADGSQQMYLDAEEIGGRFDELRVFTLSGVLVRKLAWAQAISNGWDGRNMDGELVAGGVYLLVCTTQSGSSVTGKVAVLGR